MNGLRRSMAGSTAAAIGLLLTLSCGGCVEDGYWVDRITLVLEAPANRAVVMSHDLQEGNLSFYESTMIDDDIGIVLAEVEGSGSHTLELLTQTPEQRDSVLIIAWADDPDAGEVDAPDCDEDGTRFQPALDFEDTFVVPSDAHPFAWCGALLGS